MNDHNEILMPRLSDSMEEGTIVSWLKQVGDTIAVGDDLVEIETDKATMAFEADAAGTLLEIAVAAGETCAVGAPIARVGKPGTIAHAVDRGTRAKASPVARRIAKEHGIDLAAVTGSGDGGRITKADVEALVGDDAPAPAAAVPALPAEPAEKTSPAKGAIEVVELNRMQQTVARRMAESKGTVPHFYLEASIDMSRAVEARKRLRESAADGEIVPSINDLIVKACAIALREHPQANSSYRDGSWELFSRVNVGIAVAAPGALVVPTIFDADLKGLRAIASESRQLAERVREGQITAAELSGGTFTVSNLGMYGVESFAPVVNLPQAAILAVGAIVPEAAGPDGEPGRQQMSATLACDHRILYGADAATFLARIRALLEAPLALSL